MREKIHQILEKIKNRRVANAVVMGVFAALLTAGAVTGQQKIDAISTNTGTPGYVSVSSIKNFGGGNFQSDYQGAYFYIIPDANTLANDFELGLGGTLIKTGRNKTETYRDIWQDYRKDKGDFSYLETSWQNQYLFTRWQGWTSVPAQTTDALMFVPYATYHGTSLQTGWKANESAICYYNPSASSPEDAYKVTTEKKYLNNRIFAPAYTYGDVRNYCQNGIFYKDLAKWTADKDKNLSEEDLSIKGLQKKLSSKSAIKKYVANSKTKQSQAFALWCYIMSLDGDNTALEFDASGKIDEFILVGYNESYKARNSKYNKDSNPVGVGLKDGLNGKYELERLTSAKVNDKVFINNKFAQREYNLHMLDLMLCAYATAVKQGASPSVQDAWLVAIYEYINYDVYQSNNESPAFPIAICGGTIARGADQTKDGKTVNRCVYVGSQDLVNFAGLMENASNDAEHYGELKANSRSMTKSFMGSRLGGTGNDSSYLLRMHYFSDTLNKETFKFGKHTAEKTDKQIGKYELIKQLPSYYGGYYERMKSAMNGGEVGKVKNLESTSAKEIQSWHSNVVLRAVINTMYTRDKQGNVKEVKAKSDFRESIKLTKQKNVSASGNVTYQFKDPWGAMFIPSYLWPVENTPEASFGVVLSVRSTLYAQGRAGDDNTTAEYTDAEFPDPPILKTDTEKLTWKENRKEMNDRKDFVVSTRELKDNGTEAEAFQNNKETVQLQAQVVYRTKEDKEKFQRWYNSMDKDNLKVTMTVTPLYGQPITTAKGKEIKCESKWNTSYTGTTAKSIGVTLENGKGTKLKLLNGKGCKVSKTDFKSIFMPTSGLQGVKMTLDTDSRFFKDTGFEVPSSNDGKEYVFIGYQIKLTADCVKDGTTQEYKEDATSNKAGIRYSRKLIEEGEEEMSPSYNYTSIPEDFCELKEGSVYNEQFEAMAGVPSTRSLYFSTGGSEFIVNMRSNYEANQRAERKYTSHFNGTECEYKKTDQLKSLAAGGSLTETFVGDSNDNTISKSVTAQKNFNVNPTGASSYNTSFGYHSGSTTFVSVWKGTIANNVGGRPAQIRANKSSSGIPCEGGDAGDFYDMGNAATNWDVSNYNQALQQAIDWAVKMEEISNTKDGNGWRIADSDGMKRFYHCGEAVINVNVYGSPVYSKDCGGSASYSKNGNYTSGSASNATLTSGDKNILGSGWEYTPGKKATPKGSHKTDPETGAVISHSSWTGWKGSVDGQSGTRNYVITVTFQKGTTTAENYDGSGEIGASTQNVGSSLPAHALCGPCCMHDLPAVEDKWTQIVYFDTMAILTLWRKFLELVTSWQKTDLLKLRPAILYRFMVV